VEVGFPPTPGRNWPAVLCRLAARHIQRVANGVEMELQLGARLHSIAPPERLPLALLTLLLTAQLIVVRLVIRIGFRSGIP